MLRELPHVRQVPGEPRGFKHYVVDCGNPLGTGFQTPFLYADGPFEPRRERVLAAFTRLSAELPLSVVQFVTGKLRSFNEQTLGNS